MLIIRGIIVDRAKFLAHHTNHQCNQWDQGSPSSTRARSIYNGSPRKILRAEATHNSVQTVTATSRQTKKTTTTSSLRAVSSNLISPRRSSSMPAGTKITWTVIVTILMMSTATKWWRSMITKLVKSSNQSQLCSRRVIKKWPHSSSSSNSKCLLEGQINSTCISSLKTLITQVFPQIQMSFPRKARSWKMRKKTP